MKFLLKQFQWCIVHLSFLECAMFSPSFRFIIIASALIVQCCFAQDSFSTLKTSSGRSAHLEAESQSIQSSNVDISTASYSKSESSFAQSETEISQDTSSVISTGDGISVRDSDHYLSDSTVSGLSSNIVATDGEFSQAESNFSSSSSIVTGVDTNLVATEDGAVQSSSKSFSSSKKSSSSTHSITGQFSGSDESVVFGGLSSEESLFGNLPNDLSESSDLLSQTRSLNSLPAFPDSIVRPKPTSGQFPSRLPSFPNTLSKGSSGKPRGPKGPYIPAGSFNSLKPGSQNDNPLGPSGHGLSPVSVFDNGSNSRDISSPLDSLIDSPPLNNLPTESLSNSSPVSGDSLFDQITSPDQLSNNLGPNSPFDVPFDSLSGNSPLSNDIPTESSPFPDSILEDTIPSDQFPELDSLSQSPFGDDIPDLIELETVSSTSISQSEGSVTNDSEDQYPGLYDSLNNLPSNSLFDEYPSPNPLEFEQSPLDQYPSISSLNYDKSLSSTSQNDSSDSSGIDIPIEFLSDSPKQFPGPYDSATDFPTSNSPLSGGNPPYSLPLDLNLPTETYSSPQDSFPSLSESDSTFTSFHPYDSLTPQASDIPQNDIDDLFSLGYGTSPADSTLGSLDTDQNGFVSPEEILESNGPQSSSFSPSLLENNYQQPNLDLPNIPKPRYEIFPDSRLNNDYLKPNQFLPFDSLPPRYRPGGVPFYSSPFSSFDSGKPLFPKPLSPYPELDLQSPFNHLGSNSGFPRYPLSPSRLDHSNSPLLTNPFLKASSDLNKPKSHPFSPSSSPFTDFPYGGYPKPEFPFSSSPFLHSSLPSPHLPGDLLQPSPLPDSPFGPSPLKPTITSATFKPDLYQNSPFLPRNSQLNKPGFPFFPILGKPSDSSNIDNLLNQPSIGSSPYQSGISPSNVTLKPSDFILPNPLRNSSPDSQFPGMPSALDDSFPGSQLPGGKRIPRLTEIFPRPHYKPKNWSNVSPKNSLPVSSPDLPHSLDSSISDSLSPQYPSPLDFSSTPNTLPFQFSPDSLSPHYPSPLDYSSIPETLSPQPSPLSNLPISSALLHPDSSLLDSPLDIYNSPPFSPSSNGLSSLSSLLPADDTSDQVFDILRQQYQSATTEYLSSNSVYPGDISTTLDSASEEDLTYNIVVIGSSPAALTALKTFSDLGKRILLIERGRLPPHISKSLYYRPRILQSNYVRQIKSSAPYCDAEKIIFAPNVLGEESSYDSNVWDYGVKSKYIKWGRLCKKWSWNRIVRDFPDDKQLTCPIPTTHEVEETKATSVITSIFSDAGLYRTEYTIGKRPEGLTIVPFLQENGENIILAQKIFEELADRTNINLALETKVDNIIFDNYGKAIGVNVRTSSGAVRTIFILDELILGSNPVDTVQLLYQSGIGEYEKLQQLNIPVQINLPYVGKEFLVTPLYFGIFYQFPQGTLLSEWESDLAGMDYLFGKYQLPSALALDYFKAALNIYESREANVILNFRVFSKSMSERLSSYIERFKYVDENVKDYLLNLCQNYDLLLVVPQLTNVLSRGEVYINNSSGEYETIIDTGMYRSKRDMTIMQKALKALKAIAETETFKSLNGEVVQIPVQQCGKPDFSTEYNRCSIRYLSLPNLHYSGGAIMGVNPLTSVVNEDLKVHGTSNVRIFSSAIVPYGTSTDSSAVSSMIGEHGAQIFKKGDMLT